MILYRVYLLASFIFSYSISQIVNDDYCDDLSNGLDELLSSACSYYQINRRFTCHSPYPLNLSIPLSRLNDGVCDCCDGSDENNELNSKYYHSYNSCVNTCDNDLFSYRQNALFNHRAIRAGIRKRNEILLSQKNEQNHQITSLKSKQNELTNITDLILKMNIYLYNYEIALERSHRFELLRDRQIRCANSLGDQLEPACQLFLSGYLNDHELVSNKYIYKNPPKRFVYTPTDKEIDSLNQLDGLKRVLGTLCTVSDILPLINKEKVFIRLHEYLTYMQNNYIDSYYDQLSNPLVKQYLLEKYLENGTDGFVLLAIHLLEIISFFSLPVLLPMYLIEYIYSGVYNYLHNQLIVCANGEVVTNTVNTSDSIKKRYNKKSTKAVSKKDSQEGIELVINLNNESSIYRPICKYLLSEDSYVYNYITNLFDPLAYSLTRLIYSYISPFYYIPMWITTVVYRAPKMYFDFYYQDKGSILPPRRQACLLREGIEEAKQQQIKIKNKIIEIENDIKPIKSTSNSNSNSKSSKSLIDFGIDNEYKYLNNKCVDKMIGSYLYKLCYYKNIKQNSILIGKFNGWGEREDIQENNKIDKYKYQFYSDGADCGNKVKGNLDKQIKRNTQVELICGVEDEIIEINEIELCVYNMLVSSPIVCTFDLQDQSIAQLEALQVLGFTRLKKPNITLSEIDISTL